ncbi:MAG: sulfatase [Acidobacteria bacterium]|nr:sulfatase [Acidobacteriota bacterium]MDA1236867.1 sulfatase [Acidobacteriota bacterium]
MTRREATAALGGAALSMFGCESAAPKPPNIVFFLADDQRNDSLGCAGHPFLKTPNIDGLARQGVRFENAFVTTAICAASRASIFTGLVERTHGYTFGKPPIAPEQLANGYPALLKKAGYRTGFCGKYGVQPKQDEYFDEYEEINRNPYFHEQTDGTLRHETDLCADFAEKFVASEDERPFCLSVSFNAGHAEDGDLRPAIGHYPWPPATDGMYEDIVMPEPRLADPKYREVLPEFFGEDSMNRLRYHWRWDTPEKYQANMRAYFRMLSGIDLAVGRVVEALEDNGLADNTIIVYMGDNGYMMGDRGMAGKWNHYEQSLHVPLIVYDPRVKQSRVEQRMALNIDLAPTFLELGGAELPAQYQGRSLAGFARGEQPTEWRNDFFCEHLMERAEIPKYEGVRGERYVYARYFENDYEFLHDLQEDPDELVNYTDHADYADVLATMRTRCDELRDSYGGQYESPVAV